MKGFKCLFYVWAFFVLLSVLGVVVPSFISGYEQAIVNGG